VAEVECVEVNALPKPTRLCRAIFDGNREIRLRLQRLGFEFSLSKAEPP
jgi:hypothetical protein